MTKYLSLQIYGLLIVLAGLSLILFQYFFLQINIQFVSVCILVSAAFAFLTAYKSKHKQSRFKYHRIHAIGMVIYGVAILLPAFYSLKFIHLTTFYLIYYGVVEMIFCFMLFNLKSVLGLEILIIRLITGFIIYIVASLLLFYINMNKSYVVIGDGILFIISGLQVIFYLPIVKKLDVPITSNVKLNQK